MCFGKPNLPDTAQQAREDEAKRQAQIEAGTDVVNRNFAKFTPGYYSGISDAYRANYQPQVDQQAREARRATTFRFGDNPNSSAANRVAGQLEGEYANKSADVASGSVDAANTAKQQVEQQRGGLLNLVNAGSGLDSVASQSAAFSQAYNPPTQYSPLGDLFSRYTNTLGNAAQASGQGYQVPALYQRPVDFLRGGSAGSSRNVGR
jgi:hypothetical protein